MGCRGKFGAPPRAPAPAVANDGQPPASDDRLVLVVDDNVDAALGLAELLKVWGLQTRVIHEGTAVIAAVRESSPAIVLLDIGLPGMDGYQLARLIRSEPQWRHLRLIALTGYGQARDHELSRQAGFDLHLVKPVDLDKLAAALGVTDGSNSAAIPRGISETAG